MTPDLRALRLRFRTDAATVDTAVADIDRTHRMLVAAGRELLSTRPPGALAVLDESVGRAVSYGGSVVDRATGVDRLFAVALAWSEDVVDPMSAMVPRGVALTALADTTRSTAEWLADLAATNATFLRDVAKEFERAGERLITAASIALTCVQWLQSVGTAIEAVTALNAALVRAETDARVLLRTADAKAVHAANLARSL